MYIIALKGVIQQISGYPSLQSGTVGGKHFLRLPLTREARKFRKISGKLVGVGVLDDPFFRAGAETRPYDYAVQQVNVGRGLAPAVGLYYLRRNSGRLVASPTYLYPPTASYAVGAHASAKTRKSRPFFWNGWTASCGRSLP